MTFRGFSTVFALWLFADGAQPAQPARESLAALRGRYTDIRHVGFSADAGDAAHVQIEYSSDDQFKYVDRRPGSAKPYVVAYDGATLFSSHNEGNSYEGVPFRRVEFKSPGPVQIILAPWARLSEISNGILNDARATVTQDGEEFEASSEVLGVTIRWDSSLRLTLFERHCDGPGVAQRTIFSSFALDSSGIELPTRIREILRTGVIRNGQEVGADLSFVAGGYVVNPNDGDRRLKLDPVQLGLNRFDRATHNVYSPTGELLYNEDTMSLTPATYFGLTVRTLYGAIGILLVGSAGLFYWRYRRKHGARA